eukprot:gene13693-15093_t
MKPYSPSRGSGVKFIVGFDLYPAVSPTGIVERFTIVITREKSAGSTRFHVKVNGTSPGPPLHATLGNTLEVKVINYIYDDATAIHWHGIDLHSTPWMDGMINITQCPISNHGESNTFLYRFTPISPGTFWYHGHYHNQYPDGLYGALIVQRPNEKEIYANKDLAYQYDDYLILADYYATEVRYLVPGFMAPFSNGFDPVPDAVTVNSFYSNELNLSYTFKESLTDKGRIRLRLINAATVTVFNFTVANGSIPFTIVEIDGIPVTPITLSSLRIQAAQRFSLIIDFSIFLLRKAPQKIPFQFTVNPQYYPQYDINSPNFGIITSTTQRPLDFYWNGWFELYYELEMSNVLPTAKPLPIHDPKPKPRSSVFFTGDADANLTPDEEYSYEGDCNSTEHSGGVVPSSTISPAATVSIQHDENLMTAVPEYPIPVPEADYHIQIFTVFYLLDNNEVRAFVNEETMMLNEDILPSTFVTPSLLTLSDDYQFDPTKVTNRLIPGSGSSPFIFPKNAVIDLFINGYCCGTHPFHLHGHHFWIVNTSDSQQRYDNPPSKQGIYPIRDIVTVPFGGYAHIRFVADNPGIWLFHCHVHWHLVMGLGAMFIDLGDESDYERIREGFTDDLQKSCQAPLSTVNEYSEEWTFQYFQSLEDGNYTLSPSHSPSFRPSQAPFNSVSPTFRPTKRRKSKSPTHSPYYHSPTFIPSQSPSLIPTSSPSQETLAPSIDASGINGSTVIGNSSSLEPSFKPTALPTFLAPTTTIIINATAIPTIVQETGQPTVLLSQDPTSLPTNLPIASDSPTLEPTVEPTMVPSDFVFSPTYAPTIFPTASDSPTLNPTFEPTIESTFEPTTAPSDFVLSPTSAPTDQNLDPPTQNPTLRATFSPSFNPSMEPSILPTSFATPSSSPTIEGNLTSFTPSSAPTSMPSFSPSLQEKPSVSPSIATSDPTTFPSGPPIASPSEQPSFDPTIQPSYQPSVGNTVQPNVGSPFLPSASPTLSPTSSSSSFPTFLISASTVPSPQPSHSPSPPPSLFPSSQASKSPSFSRSTTPTCSPSLLPSIYPSVVGPDRSLQIQYLLYISSLPLDGPQHNNIMNALILLLAEYQQLNSSHFTMLSYGTIQSQFLSSSLRVLLYDSEVEPSLSKSSTSSFNILATIDPISSFYPSSMYYNNISLIFQHLEGLIVPNYENQSLTISLNDLLTKLRNTDYNVTIVDFQMMIFDSQFLQPSIVPTLSPSTNLTTAPIDGDPTSKSSSQSSVTLTVTSIVLIAVFCAIALSFVAVMLYFAARRFSEYKEQRRAVGRDNTQSRHEGREVDVNTMKSSPASQLRGEDVIELNTMSIYV